MAILVETAHDEEDELASDDHIFLRLLAEVFCYAFPLERYAYLGACLALSSEILCSGGKERAYFEDPGESECCLEEDAWTD